MFIDETEITVSSGRGGDGLVSFRREKFVPRGGPDGGDGGRGGDVVLRASTHLNTLAGLQHRRRYKAGNGQPGGANNRTGRDGESLLIEVPVGTLVRDRERGHVLRDLSAADMEFVVVAGGRGGKGNKHFAHSTNQTPRRATQGQDGVVRELRLELRLVADVGLVGLPNAGKSTFLSRVSAARPKVADYPFTTLEPVLGIVHREELGLVIADIPGLIEGAHAGAGLGDRFLRHVARTRVLLHLVDASEGAEVAIKAFRTVRSELELSGLDLKDKPVVVALSRADTVEDPAAVAHDLEQACSEPVCVLSAHTGLGVADVLGRLARLLEDIPRAAATAPAPTPEFAGGRALPSVESEAPDAGASLARDGDDGEEGAGGAFEADELPEPDAPRR
jgi:GTPase